MQCRCFALLSGIVVLATASSVQAQPKPGYLPSSTHIFPAGGQRGTTVSVRVGTECAPPKTQFSIIGDGVSGDAVLASEVASPGETSAHRKPTIIPITYPREWSSEIRITEDAPFGPAYWRLSCAQGGTASRPFLVGDLPEFIESESNSTPSRAEAVTLPVTLNGQIHGERDSDHFRFALKAGEIVSCEVIAGRIGSPLDPVVDLVDPDGRPIDSQRVHIGSDPVLIYRADTDRDVILRIAHVNHRGDPSFVYRIDLRDGPFYRTAVPGGLNPGEGANIELFALTGDRLSLTEKLGILRGDDESDRDFLTWRNPIEPANPFRFSIDTHPIAAEQEPNNSLADSNPLQIPTTTYGQFSAADDRDVFTVACNKGDRLRIDCRPWPPGTPAIPNVRIADIEQKTLASANAASTDDGIVRMTWTAPANGDFEVQVADLRFGSRGGNDFVYRLVVQPDEPDFELEFDSDSLTATQGQTALLTVHARRHGGLIDVIKLNFEGLPEGVTVEDAEIPAGKNSGKVKFNVEQSARVSSFRLEVTGTVADQDITRTARCRHLGVDNEGVSVGSPFVRSLFLTVQHKPLFRLECAEAYQYAHRGSVFMYPMKVERLDGFDGVIQLQRGDRQNRDMDGVRILNATLGPGQSDIEVPIYLPESMAINVQSQTQLYSQAWASFTDQHGLPQTVLVLSEKRNMLRTLPPVVKLNAAHSRLTVSGETTVECPLTLDRTSNFPGTMQIELRDAPPGVSADPVEIEPGDTRATAYLGFGGPLSEPISLTFRGRGKLEDGTVIISESTVEFVPVD